VKVSDLGEFGLIQRLSEIVAGRLPTEAQADLLLGIGDDAAVWRLSDGALLATTDTLVEDVHFLPSTPWQDVGWKALVANLSDIAAMGGAPEFALVTIGLPHDRQVEAVDELYVGLTEAAGAYGVAIAGGDIVRSPAFFVSIALTGRAALDASGQPLVLRRDGASAGEVIAVTGALGGAAGGLRALQGGLDGDTTRLLVKRHRRPQPRLEAGRAAIAAGIRCAIDVSDGLMQDLGHVCQASRLGATVYRDNLPVEPALAELFTAEEVLAMAATGGEDYELVLVGAPEQLERARSESGVPITTIGEMVDDADHGARLLDESGREVSLAVAGWDHLRA
jgi:thiamine-monophosphate kinase